MTTATDIRTQVGRFLKGQITLRTLRSRVTPLRWDTENPPDQSAMDMLRMLGRYFAEFSNGDWSEADMRKLLVPYGPGPRYTLTTKIGGNVRIRRRRVRL